MGTNIGPTSHRVEDSFKGTHTVPTFGLRIALWGHEVTDAEKLRIVMARRLPWLWTKIQH